MRKCQNFQHGVPEAIEGHFHQADFYEVALVRTIKLDKVLISGMVERWRLETHTFHMSSEECIITLEDDARCSSWPTH